MSNIQRRLRLIHSWFGQKLHLNRIKPETWYPHPWNNGRQLAASKKSINSPKILLQIIGVGTPEPSTRLEVFLLGKLRASFNKRTLERWSSRKGKFLFAYLILNRTRRVSRDTLMEMFWPRSAPQSARNCLNVTMHGVRQQLQTINDRHRHEIILYNNESYFINPKIEIWLDTEAFEKAWKEGRRRERQDWMHEAISSYTQAARIYTGDLLEENPYEDWLTVEREHLKEVYLFILDKISRYYSLDGDPYTAINLCESMLEKDNCQEEIYRRLMFCYYRIGSRDKAIKHYHRCAEVMRKELDVDPTTETVLLYEKIRKEEVGIESNQEHRPVRSSTASRRKRTSSFIRKP